MRLLDPLLDSLTQVVTIPRAILCVQSKALNTFFFYWFSVFGLTCETRVSNPIFIPSVFDENEDMIWLMTCNTHLGFRDLRDFSLVIWSEKQKINTFWTQDKFNKTKTEKSCANLAQSTNQHRS